MTLAACDTIGDMAATYGRSHCDAMAIYTGHCAAPKFVVHLPTIRFWGL